MKRLLLVLAAVLTMGAASDPAERLADPAAEARARALFKEVRCLVCQSESIDDSQAPFAADLRRTVREQLSAGASDQQVRAFLTARYGEYVLLRPPFNAANALLWIGPFLLLVIGAAAWMVVARRREPPQALSAQEEKRLSAMLGDGQD